MLEPKLDLRLSMQSAREQLRYTVSEIYSWHYNCCNYFSNTMFLGEAMAKALILSAYVAIVLLTSALVRAELTTQRVSIQEITYENETGTLLVEGELPNPCYSNPRLTTRFDQRSYEVKLIVQADAFTGPCIQTLGQPFAFSRGSIDPLSSESSTSGSPPPPLR
jgi:hypothetical protein